jgi:hypothetical protein
LVKGRCLVTKHNKNGGAKYYYSTIFLKQQKATSQIQNTTIILPNVLQQKPSRTMVEMSLILSNATVAVKAGSAPCTLEFF